MLADGKLITLTINKAASTAHAKQYPLDRLPFYFPVPPGEIKHSISATHADSGVIRRGGISQFGGPDLDEVSWEGEFIVSEWFSDSAGSLRGPGLPSYVIAPPAGFTFYSAHAAIALLKDIAHGGYVIDLTVQDRNTGRIEIHQPVTLRSFVPVEKGGEPDTRFYSITFKQYRFLTLRTVPRGGVVENTGTPRPDAGGRYTSSPYIVRMEGIGIKSIAQIAYHDRSQWRRIVQANGGFKGMFAKKSLWRPKDRNGPFMLRKGAKLVIPMLRSNSNSNKPELPPVGV